MKTMKILALMSAAVLMLSACGGKTKKQEDGGAAAKERTTQYKITSDGVGPVNFRPGAGLPVLDGYAATVDDNGKLTVKADDGETVMVREWETITVYGPEFKTENGVHVGMPIGEAVTKMLDGETLIVYGAGTDEAQVSRRFTSGDVVEEDDNVTYWVKGSAVKGESLAKLQADPRAAVEDLDPDAEITKITIVELL